MAAEIAAPLSHAKKLTMVSSGSSEVGVSKVTTEVLQVVERLPKMVEGVTGVDIAKVLAVLLYFMPPFATLLVHCKAATSLVSVDNVKIVTTLVF